MLHGLIEKQQPCYSKHDSWIQTIFVGLATVIFIDRPRFFTNINQEIGPGNIIGRLVSVEGNLSVSDLINRGHNFLSHNLHEWKVYDGHN